MLRACENLFHLADSCRICHIIDASPPHGKLRNGLFEQLKSLAGHDCATVCNSRDIAPGMSKAFDETSLHRIGCKAHHYVGGFRVAFWAALDPPRSPCLTMTSGFRPHEIIGRFDN